jgi:uncharacterized protein YqfA (UPF0365 family)
MEALLVVVGLFLLLGFMYYLPIELWITAISSGVRVGLVELALMRIRKVSSRIIVESLITSTKAGLNLTVADLEAHYLAGGHVPSVVKALISAKAAGLPLTYAQATSLDLMGSDAFAFVTGCVYPKSIQTRLIGAVTKDGHNVVLRLRLLVKLHFSKLCVMPSEHEIIAVVSEQAIVFAGTQLTYQSLIDGTHAIGDFLLSKWSAHNCPYDLQSAHLVYLALADKAENRALVNRYWFRDATQPLQRRREKWPCEIKLKAKLWTWLTKRQVYPSLASPKPLPKRVVAKP